MWQTFFLVLSSWDPLPLQMVFVVVVGGGLQAIREQGWDLWYRPWLSGRAYLVSKSLAKCVYSLFQAQEKVPIPLMNVLMINKKVLKMWLSYTTDLNQQANVTAADRDWKAVGVGVEMLILQWAKDSVTFLTGSLGHLTEAHVSPFPERFEACLDCSVCHGNHTYLQFGDY